MAAYDILTAAEVKAYMGILSSSTDKDTIIGTFISDVSLWIENYLEKKVVSQTVTDEKGSGDGTEFYYPKYSPVTAVTTLTYRGTPTSSYANVVSNSSNILVDPDGDYIEVYGTVFPYGRLNLKLTYTAGYSTVPNEIKQVAYEMVATRFRESNDPALGQNRLGIQSKSRTEGGGVTNASTFVDMLPRWERILKRYVRKVPVRLSR